METVRSGLARVVASWRGLDGEGRLAAGAALLLLFTLFLPWYSKSYFVPRKGGGVDRASESISGLGSAGFVLASIMLVAVSVLALEFFRGERRGFHLPFGDGVVIFAAGAWCTFLTFYRIVDPIDAEGQGATVGVKWGVVVSFLASALLAFAGARIRATHRPEPPLPQAESRRAAADLERTIAAPDRAPTRVAPPRRRAKPRPGDDRPFPGQMAFGEGDAEDEGGPPPA